MPTVVGVESALGSEPVVPVLNLASPPVVPFTEALAVPEISELVFLSAGDPGAATALVPLALVLDVAAAFV